MSKIGIIGGSALYAMEGLEIVEKKEMLTPFGKPSDEFVIGRFAGKEVIFLPRHGRSHGILPTEINNRANIYGFKMLGVNRIISVSAVGSLKEELRPLDVVLVDQFVDRTNQARPVTFFGNGIVGHISFAEPVCPELRNIIYNSAQYLDITAHNGGIYINMEGPAFSTKAESRLYKSWGMDVIGMTNMPEARLAREAGICYAVMAMVTDYDSWHSPQEAESVSIEMIIQNLKTNIKNAKVMLMSAIKNIPEKTSCACSESLCNAIVTAPNAVPEDLKKKLKPIIGEI